ncbi:MAG: GntR family transcriptional regulator [Thalassobaculum sp.]|uniref:GntR family transcriptional regulator n=1 Tax=Thalassobaculum sp. TaxID=2022740 RepID=UPI0032ED6FE4
MPDDSDKTEILKRWSFDRKRPLVDQVYDDLRRRILAFELAPDVSLSRQELSDHYGISQTPLRDAIGRLERDGLVEIYPQSKTVVTRIDVGLVRETQFMRTAFEVEIVGMLAADPDKAKIAPAGEAVERMQWVLERDPGFDEFNRLDKAFHRCLYAAADKLGLCELVESRSGQLDRIRRLHLQLREESKSAQVVADHARIVAAIRASDVDSARAAMRVHLSGTLSRLDVLREHFPGWFA